MLSTLERGGIGGRGGGIGGLLSACDAPAPGCCPIA
jgi:hypothetical protein